MAAHKSAADSGGGAILPTWTSVDNLNFRTSRELWGQMKEEGWNVDVRTPVILSDPVLTLLSCQYHWIRITPDRPIEDNYLDAYLRVIRAMDPLLMCLQNRNSQSAIELLMTQPALLDNLRKARMGNYGIILSLLGCLDHGLQAKPDRDTEVSFLFSQFGGNDTYCSASQIKFMRKSYGPRLNVFAPIRALSSLSKTNWEDRAVTPGRRTIRPLQAD
ncbi:hypothetical protein B0H14DRAFT_3636762 [Mycena olivaceomarginata]|nr:hypothetical protein B0H14DRAFT_3636762 [Mycena olivaceomarginata]